MAVCKAGLINDLLIAKIFLTWTCILACLQNRPLGDSDIVFSAGRWAPFKHHILMGGSAPQAVELDSALVLLRQTMWPSAMGCTAMCYTAL